MNDEGEIYQVTQLISIQWAKYFEIRFCGDLKGVTIDDICIRNNIFGVVHK